MIAEVLLLRRTLGVLRYVVKCDGKRQELVVPLNLQHTVQVGKTVAVEYRDYCRRPGVRSRFLILSEEAVQPLK